MSEQVWLGVSVNMVSAGSRGYLVLNLNVNSIQQLHVQLLTECQLSHVCVAVVTAPAFVYLGGSAAWLWLWVNVCFFFKPQKSYKYEHLYHCTLHTAAQLLPLATHWAATLTIQVQGPQNLRITIVSLNLTHICLKLSQQSMNSGLILHLVSLAPFNHQCLVFPLMF